jgi:hypothetical protein
MELLEWLVKGQTAVGVCLCDSRTTKKNAGIRSVDA